MKAVECSAGAKNVVRCVKIEGGFNRAFVLELDNGASVVARISFRNAGPARLTTNSEVATIEYLRKHTSIPVPEVLGWSDAPSNPTGTEYIIMQHAPGTQLHQRWPSMSSHEHMLTVKALANMMKELASIDLPAYGSLYFADAPVEKSRLVELYPGFCVGPHCGTRYWPCTPGDDRLYTRVSPNLGPWSTHEDYCHALIDAGMSRIPEKTPPGTLGFQGDVDEHIRLNNAARQVLSELSGCDAIRGVDRPMLLHPDLHKRNIFVSDDNPSQITCVIDWQSSSIEPAHCYADELPDLCTFPETWDETAVEDPPTHAQQRTIKDVSICRRTWEVLMMSYMPQVFKTRGMDQDLLRPFRYAASSWRHGAVPFRDNLIKVSQRWSEFSLEDVCSYQPAAEELARQKALWGDFLEAHEVKQQLVSGLHTDAEGWVPSDRWEDTKAAYDTLLQEWLDAVVASGEMTMDKARKMWPFDF